MSSRPELKLDWCSHPVAKYAVESWHYSGCLPAGPSVRCGLWEGGEFIGCVLFGHGATGNLVKPYGLTMFEGAELTRVALRPDHRAPVSRVVAIALKMVKRLCPGLRLIVSFADPAEGHVGVIYQAGGWLYTGTTESSKAYLAPDGKFWHERTVSPSGIKRHFGKPRACWRPEQCRAIVRPGKHRYLFPLDDEMRVRIAPLAKPYPKRPISIDSDAATAPGCGTRCKSDDGASQS